MIEAVAPNQILPLLQCYIAMPLLVLWSRRQVWLRSLSGLSPLRRLARILLHAVVAAWTVLALLVLSGFHLSRVSGLSMAPTFFDGEWVVSSGNAYALHWPFWGEAFTRSRVPNRGDVITFYHEDPNTHAPTLLIKRVVGVPGVVIVQVRGGLRINGHALQAMERPGGDPVAEGHFVRFGSLERAFPRPASWVVGSDEVFVMGDHWDGSWDSRAWGVLPVTRIATKVLNRGATP